ncbi:DENN domain [Phytophthora cinnamomi]|uniref:DENN domain n=1 Tax=Phytophthora cinnamomi TaxID=4785 RepID=UPI00355A6900|nr:DENN domain [Phytophthora cinnamomi]
MQRVLQSKKKKSEAPAPAAAAAAAAASSSSSSSSAAPAAASQDRRLAATSASSPSLHSGHGRRHAATLYHHKSAGHAALSASSSHSNSHSNGNGNGARDQVVVGLAASTEDEVEDWSSDFLAQEPAAAAPRARWRRQDSVGADLLLADALYKRRSSSSSNGAQTRNRRGSEVAASSGSGGSGRHSGGAYQADEDDARALLYGSYSSSVKDAARGGAARAQDQQQQQQQQQPEDASDSDEDWDAEFGFDEQTDAALGPSDSMDPTRRRAENGNFFLPNLHEVLDGESLPDDDEADSADGVSFNLDGAGRRQRRPSDEPLFQRRRSDFHQSGASVDGSVDGVRSSMTSASASSSNAIEYSLVDKLRLLEVANSSAYAVRIERYPKPSSTFSSLERDRANFPSFTENKYERWLADLVVPDCAVVSHHMDAERNRLPPPRQLKNQQFHALVSLPFGREFVNTFFKQITHYRYFGEDKENRELVRMYFEKVSTTGMTDENWAQNLSPSDLEFVVGSSIEILQEAARLYGPKPVVPLATHLSLSMLSTSSSASTQGNKTTIYWIQQFQDILVHCAEAFPQHSNVVALIELRYVCHHLAGFASGEYEYKWQICNQLPAFLPLEPVVGDSASQIVNEVLQYYGALFQHLNTSPESRSSNRYKSSGDKRNQPSEDARHFALSSDVICLQALILCDIQSLYDSKSALAEISLPALEELLEFEDDEATVDPILWI